MAVRRSLNHGHTATPGERVVRRLRDSLSDCYRMTKHELPIHLGYENKAASNIVDHEGVTFDEASTVFDSSLARIFDDEIHSFDEK